jgi:hypothetical protein
MGTPLAVALVTVTLSPKAALGEFLLRPPRRPGAALAAGRAITPAAGIVVFIAVAGHERSQLSVRMKMRTDWHSSKARALGSSRILTQNRYPRLLKALLVAGFFR